jgi:predicted transcriptional regulator
MSVTRPTETAKQQAIHLLEQLPDDATWDDVVYEFAVRRSIDRGLKDAAAGRVVSSEQLRASLGLD